MNENTVPLLPALVKRAKDAARAVKEGVHVPITVVENEEITKLVGLNQIEIYGYGIERNNEQDIVHLYGKIKTGVAICPCCHTLTTAIKEYKRRCVRDCDVWSKRTFVHLEVRRFECGGCGHRFREELQAVNWRRRQTVRFEKEVYEACLASSKKEVASNYHLSDSTVRKIFKRWTKKVERARQWAW